MRDFESESAPGVLLSREAGSNARHQIERILVDATLSPGDPVALDFDGVIAVSVPFVDEGIGQLMSGRLAGYYEDHPILAINASEDVRETVSAVLRLRRLHLLGIHDGRVELMGADELLAATLAAASKAGRFSAGSLASELGLSHQAMNNRLKALLRSGALHRTRILPSRGGKEFQYEVPRNVWADSQLPIRSSGLSARKDSQEHARRSVPRERPTRTKG